MLATAVSGAAADSLLPLLTVDGQTFVGSPIAYAAGGKAERGQPPRGGLGGAFGPGGALGSRDAFVAEWLEIEITPPGGPTETLRRSLLDRAGPAWRASAAHDAAALASIQRCQGKPCAVAGILHLWISVGAHDLRTWVKAAHRAAWLVQAHASTPKPEGPAEAAARVEERVWVEAMRTFTLPWLGDELARRTLDDDPDVRVLLDGPRIALVGTALAKEGDRTLAQTTTDLVRDRVRALSRTAASDGRALERKVRYGLLQGALEHELLAEDAASVGAEASVVTTSGQAAQGALFTMLPKDAASTSTVFSGADAALRAREALEAGATLVVAEASRSGPSASWWRVDADGQTTAVLDGLGGGRALGWVSAAGPDGVVPQEDPGLGGHRPPGPGPKAPSSPPSSRPPPPSGPRPADQIGPRRPGDFPRGGRGGGGGSGGGPGGGGGGGEEEGKRKGGGNEYMAMVKYVTIAVFVAAAIGIGYYIGAYTTLGERMAEAIDSGTPSAGTTPTGGGPAPPR